MTTDDINGTSGRFLRIENKIDQLVETITEVRLDVASIKAATREIRNEKADQTSINNIEWLRRGVLVSLLIGAGNFIAIIFYHGRVV